LDGKEVVGRKIGRKKYGSRISPNIFSHPSTVKEYAVQENT
jgi:hypothetical protein